MEGEYLKPTKLWKINSDPGTLQAANSENLEKILGKTDCILALLWRYLSRR